MFNTHPCNNPFNQFNRNESSYTKTYYEMNKPQPYYKQPIPTYSIQPQIKTEPIKTEPNISLHSSIEPSKSPDFAYQLNKTQMSEVCKYFTSINDFINIILASKKFREIFEVMKFNPISVNERTVQYFKNIETLHLYNKHDKKYSVNRIKKYVCWFQIPYCEYNDLVKIQSSTDTQYKRVIFSNKDRKTNGCCFKPEMISFGEKACQYLLESDLTIPTHIKSLGNYCFRRCKLKQLIIPSSITFIGFNCFKDCENLVELTISDSWSLNGDRMFHMNAATLSSFKLPDLLKRLNGKPVVVNNLLSFTIPNYITRLDNFCFCDCDVLGKLEIPSSVKSIGDYCFTNCSQLFSLQITTTVKEFGKNCFQGCPKLDLQKNIPFYTNGVKENVELTREQSNQIEEWCKKRMDSIIFDSTIDNWSVGPSVFHEKLMEKQNFVIVVETQDDVRFGCYMNSHIVKQGYDRKVNDPNAFVFSFLNNTANKYKIKPSRSHKALEVCGPNWYVLFTIGDDVIVGKEDCISTCQQRKERDGTTFDYEGMTKALIGKEGENCFIPKRIQVIQMK